MVLCEICERNEAEGDTVLVPEDPETFAAFEARHRESGTVPNASTWPKVTTCGPCTETARPVFEWLGTLPAPDLGGVTSIVLKALCRLHANQPLPPPK